MKIKSFLLLFAGVVLYQTASAQVTFLQTTKGLLYHIYTPNTGDKIKLNDVITFDVIQKTDKDSVLFSTYAKGNPVKLQVQPSQNIGDLMDIFPLLADKDSVMVKVPCDSLFKGHEEQRPPFLGKGSSLLFAIKIQRVQALQDAIAERDAAMAKVKAESLKLKGAELPAMQKYIADNKLVPKTTLSGLKYVITKPSLKAKPQKGDTVYVNYIGRTLAGKVFDTSIQSVAQEAGIVQPGRPYEPLTLVLGTGQVIKGWEEGLLLLNNGSKAKFIIPSALAYGENAAGPDIAPYSTLVFDLELVKVRPIKHPVKPGVKKGTHTVAKKTTTVKK